MKKGCVVLEFRQKACSKNVQLPQTVWMLWLQGWSEAPSVVKASLASWRRQNPEWNIQALDRETLHTVLDSIEIARIFDKDKENEAASDLIRIELLHRYGGVWADATTVCLKPLEDWIHNVTVGGFFAFARPGPDRMLSTWFLAAKRGSYIVQAWRASTLAYWLGREVRHDYFWFHQLFECIYKSDIVFRGIWDRTPFMSADNAFHFGPNSDALRQRKNDYYISSICNPPTPVAKLTHKFNEECEPNSLLDFFLAFAQGRDSD